MPDDTLWSCWISQYIDELIEMSLKSGLKFLLEICSHANLGLIKTTAKCAVYVWCSSQTIKDGGIISGLCNILAHIQITHYQLDIWKKRYFISLSCKCLLYSETFPDSKFHGANMGPTWVLSAPDGPHVGLTNLAIRVINHIYISDLKLAGSSYGPLMHCFSTLWNAQSNWERFITVTSCDPAAATGPL